MRKVWPMAAIALAFPMLVIGQSIPLLEVETGGTGVLSSEQLTRYDYLISILPEEDSVLSTDIVNVNDLVEASENDYFYVDFGGDCDHVTYFLEHVEYEDAANFSSFSETPIDENGTIYTNACLGATLYFMAHEGVYYGELPHQDVTYKLFDLTENRVLMVGFNPAYTPLCYEPTGSNSTSPGGGSLAGSNPLSGLTTGTTAAATTSSNCIVDVVYAYTNGAKSYITDVIGFNSVVPFFDTQVGFFSYATHKSSDDGQHALIRRAYMLDLDTMEVRDYSIGDSFVATVRRLIPPGINYDVIQTFATTQPSDYTGLVAGEGKNGTPRDGRPAHRDSADSYVVITMGSTTTISAHEIGHNFGLHHEVDYSLQATHNRAKAFTYSKISPLLGYDWAATIMNASVGNFSKPNFSNPNVTFYGTPTGDWNKKNQWYLNQNMCTVAANGDNSASAYAKVYITGLSNLCPGATATLTAHNEKSTNASFQWYITSGGFNNWVTAGNAPTLTVTAPALPSSGIPCIRTKVVSTTGSTTDTRYFTVFVSNFNYGMYCDSLKSSPAYISKVPSDIQLFPNPTTGICHIKFNQALRHDAHIKLVSANGAVLMTSIAQEGEDEFVLNLKPYPTGTYMLNVKNKTLEKTFKFIYDDLK